MIKKISLVVVVSLAALVPAKAFAQSATSTGSGIGPSAATTGTVNTPGTVGATFAPQGGIGIQNYGISNPSVTGVAAPNVGAGMVGPMFTPQGSTGVQNYGTTNPGTLPNVGMVPLPNFSSSTNYGTTNNYGTAVPSVLPNTLLAPAPNFGLGNQSALSSGASNNSGP